MTAQPSVTAQSYTLSEAQSQKIFDQEIVPAEFHDNDDDYDDNGDNDPEDQAQAHRRPRRPVAVFVIGQTGSGKSRTAPIIKQALVQRTRRRGALALAHFVADTYKTYHPEYDRLVDERGPAFASAATGRDARRWLEMAAKQAATRRKDVLLESACRHAEDFAVLVHTFRDADYRIEVIVMAVSAALSRLGILMRFHGRCESESELESEAVSSSSSPGKLKLSARLTPTKVHDESYQGLLLAARFVDESPAVDQVVVLRRGNVVAHANERDERGVWRKSSSLLDALVRERERRLPRHEREAAFSGLERLMGKTTDVPGLSAQIAEMEELLRPVVMGSPDSDSGEDHDEESIQQKTRPLLRLPNVDDGYYKNDSEVHLNLGLDLS